MESGFMRLSVLFALLFSVALVTACARQKEYHYWQKQDPSSSLYLTGVKAQQTLEQDIAECVHVVIELTKLGDVRGHVPAMMQPLGSYDQKEATQSMSKLPYWDVPEYIRDLRVDHTDFHDFDGCMAHKGWQRVKYVAPEAERRANQIYDDTGHYSVRPVNAKDAAYQREINSLENGRRKD
jgi:hypothetical protein